MMHTKSIQRHSSAIYTTCDLPYRSTTKRYGFNRRSGYGQVLLNGTLSNMFNEMVFNGIRPHLLILQCPQLIKTWNQYIAWMGERVSCRRRKLASFTIAGATNKRHCVRCANVKQSQVTKWKESMAWMGDWMDWGRITVAWRPQPMCEKAKKSQMTKWKESMVWICNRMD